MISEQIPPLRRLVQERQNLHHDKGVLQLEKGQLEADIRDLIEVADNPRNFLARHYIRGSGIEIGAAQLPVKLPSQAHVQYVDVLTANELRAAWPRDYTKLDIIEIDVIDDGEKLDNFKKGSLDFIIANHFFEHCIDPIGTLIHMYAKLRKDGVLYMAIPDKRYTFDKPRPLTTYDHLLEEHRDKTKNKFRRAHTEEFLRLGDKYKGDLAKRTQEILDSGYRVHYHVWTSREITEVFTRAVADFGLDMEIQAQLKNGHEVIYVLRKLA